MDPLCSVPPEIAVDVLACGVLDPADLARIARVSRRWGALVRDEAVWRTLAQRWGLELSRASEQWPGPALPASMQQRVSDAYALCPPLISPQTLDAAARRRPVAPPYLSWRAFVTLHHLSAALFGRPLGASPKRTAPHASACCQPPHTTIQSTTFCPLAFVPGAFSGTPAEHADGVTNSSVFTGNGLHPAHHHQAGPAEHDDPPAPASSAPPEPCSRPHVHRAIDLDNHHRAFHDAQCTHAESLESENRPELELELAHYEMSAFRSLGHGLIAATGVQGGVVVQSDDHPSLPGAGAGEGADVPIPSSGHPLVSPLWHIPASEAPPGSRIETDSTRGILVLLAPSQRSTSF